MNINMAIKINQIGGLLGARVEGIDFAQPLNDGIFEQIADALYQHQVISIPAMSVASLEFNSLKIKSSLLT